MKILKFGAEWCAPCKKLHKTLSEMEVEFEEYDAADDGTVFEKYQIKALPTLVFLSEDGVELGRMSGARSRNDIEQMMEDLL